MNQEELRKEAVSQLWNSSMAMTKDKFIECVFEIFKGAEWEAENYNDAEKLLPPKYEGADDASEYCLCYSEKGGIYFISRYCYYFNNWEYEKGIHQTLYPISHWKYITPPKTSK